MLDTDSIVAVLLSGTPAARAHALQRLRRHAEQQLHAACERVGVTVADLADNDRAVVANLLMQKAGIERSERKAAALVRWCIEAEERPETGDRAVVRIVQALRDMGIAIASEQQQTARESSKAAREAQAGSDAAAVADLFASAWRAGMGRVGLQAAAAGVLRERELRLRDQLITAQQVDNKALQRRLSAALQTLQRQTVLCTVHRAGKWLQQHRGGP